MEPEKLFAFRWHPHAMDAGVDYSSEPTTLVAFTLEEIADGVKLTVTESGFDQIPLARRATAFSANEQGWGWSSRSSRPTLPTKARPGFKPKRAAPVFAALGDETRLKLVVRLCDDGPLSITTLTKGSRVTRQAITKHLHVMEQAGLVRNSRNGRESVWQLDHQPIDDARHYLDLISKEWDAALARLQEFVED